MVLSLFLLGDWEHVFRVQAQWLQGSARHPHGAGTKPGVFLPGDVALTMPPTCPALPSTSPGHLLSTGVWSPLFPLACFCLWLWGPSLVLVVPLVVTEGE